MAESAAEADSERGINERSKMSAGPTAGASSCTLRASSIPKGLCPPAQGCEERATLGNGPQEGPTLKGLRRCSGAFKARNVLDATVSGLNPRCDCTPRLARSSQPWALG